MTWGNTKGGGMSRIFEPWCYNTILEWYNLPSDRYWRRIGLLCSPVASSERCFYRRGGRLDQRYKLRLRRATIDYLGDGSMMVTPTEARDLDRGFVSEYDL